MTYEELKASLAEYDKLKRKAVYDFVMAHNTVKVGDILEKHTTKIRVDAIKISHGWHGRPYAMYEGADLKKDGTPTKRGTRSTICGDSPLPDGEHLKL